jgi:hypothetical protein
MSTHKERSKRRISKLKQCAHAMGKFRRASLVLERGLCGLSFLLIDGGGIFCDGFQLFDDLSFRNTEEHP